MPDYGHDLQFGVFVTPSAGSPRHAVHLAQLAEDAGLDLVTFQDHPYQPAFLDTWTLLSYVGAATERISLAPNVANLPLRPPAVLARSVASLDLLTGGRVELALGAGSFWNAIVAMGGPRRTPGESVEALEDAIAVIRELWDPTRRLVRAGGRHYRIDGSKPGTAPAHDVGIWIGAYGPRMLRLTGRLADGWLPSADGLPPEKLAAANAVIDEAAHGAGRSPADVRRLYNISGSFDGAGANISGSFEGAGAGFLQGSPSVWSEQLAELATSEGTGTLILQTDDEKTIERFAAEVAPRVRELVLAEREGR